ncbi:MAG: hypothetical protein CMN32_04205 [Saprospirales bacterium]|nr:hypothetical protein [Saprospirales bacterium]
MAIRHFILTIYLVTIILACQYEYRKPKLNKMSIESTSLSHIGTIDIPTTSTSAELSDIYYHNHLEETLMAILNSYELTVDFVSFEEAPVLKKSFKLPLEGPNGMQAADSYLSIIITCPDHQLLIWNNATRSFYKYDMNGTLLKKYHLGNFPQGVLPSVQATVPAISTEEGKYIISLWLENPSSPDFTNEPAVGLMELESDNTAFSLTKTLLDFPDVYKLGFWSFAPFKYTPYLCQIDSLHIFVSFPVDEYVRKLKVKEGQITASSKIIHPEVETPMPMFDYSFLENLYHGIIAKPSFEENAQYALTNSDYSIVVQVSDKHFARVSNIRPNLPKYKSGVTFPDYGVTLFDHELNILGDTIFSHGAYSFEKSFYKKNNGLHVLNMERTAEVDGYLSFDIFTTKVSANQ